MGPEVIMSPRKARVRIMEKNMETTTIYRLYRGNVGVIQGIFRDNGTGHGNDSLISI